MCGSLGHLLLGELTHVATKKEVPWLNKFVKCWRKQSQFSAFIVGFLGAFSKPVGTVPLQGGE